MNDLLQAATRTAQLLADSEGQPFTVWSRGLEVGSVKRYIELHFLPASESGPEGSTQGPTLQPQTTIIP